MGPRDHALLISSDGPVPSHPGLNLVSHEVPFVAAARDTEGRPRLLRLIRCNLQWHGPSPIFPATTVRPVSMLDQARRTCSCDWNSGRCGCHIDSFYNSVSSGDRGNRGYLLPKHLGRCFSAGQHGCQCSGCPIDPRLLPGTECSTESIIHQAARGLSRAVGLYRVVFSTAESRRFLG